MPLLSETPNRNTLNQRASRARKQEYITSLENKIREHEQRGVHATAEVQNAARQVAEENHMLKDELTVLREHVRCLEDALTRQGVVEILNDEGHVEGTVKGDQGGRVVWRAPSPSSGSGSSSTTNKKQKRQLHQHQYPPAAVKPESADDSNQYPSPPDEQVYKESQHDRKRRRTSHDMSSFDDQEAASILLSTATTPVTYEDSSSATSSSYHSSGQNQHYANDPWRPQQPSLVSSNLESSQRYPVAHPQQQQQQQQQRRSSPNSTPCEEAALIIASMRGMHPAAMDGAEMQIMNDLGCDAREGSQRCNVDNVRLFGIMAGESS